MSNALTKCQDAQSVPSAHAAWALAQPMQQVCQQRGLQRGDKNCHLGDVNCHRETAHDIAALHAAVTILGTGSDKLWHNSHQNTRHLAYNVAQPGTRPAIDRAMMSMKWHLRFLAEHIKYLLLCLRGKRTINTTQQARA